MKITCITTVPSPSLAAAAHKLTKEFDLDIDLKIYYPHSIDEEKVNDEALKGDLLTSQAVLVDIRGSGRSIDIVYETLKDEKNIVVNLVSPASKIMSITRLGSFHGSSISGRIKGGEDRDPEEVWKRISMAEKAIQAAGKIIPIGPPRDAANYIKIARYWRYGGEENYRNLMLLLLREYLGCVLPKAGDPVDHADCGIYHPSFGYFYDLESFLTRAGFDPERPTIGYLFYGNMHFDQCLNSLKGLIEEMKDFNHIPIFSDGINNLKSMGKFFFRDGRPLLDALVNLTLFRINGGPMGGNHALTKDLLKELNVPVFTPAGMFSREIEEWKKSETGLSPIESIMAVIWPELDGCIEPIPHCGVQKVSVGGLEASQIAAIDDRVQRIAARIRSWIELKRKANCEKRVAVIIYNYPPGEENLGRASYLDVFASVSLLLERLKEEGYNVNLPEKKLHEVFQDLSLVNSGKWLRMEEALKSCFCLSASEYSRFFETLPESMHRDVLDSWGVPPGRVMSVDDKILIPGVVFGNIFVGVQPARPPLSGEALAKASHDKTRPPHHQYIAFYHWLEAVWKTDVVIHVGTHGLAEFTKGKEVGLSSECFPDLLIGNMPHLYFYHVVNTSEVVIAKRRLYGTTIGYNSPAYSTSGLYEEYEALQALIDELGEAQIQDPSRCQRIEESILGKAKELNISSDNVESIHEELYDMRRRIIPHGLHILGEEYDIEARKRFMEFTLRYDRNGFKSLNRILAEAQGLDYDRALRNKKEFASMLQKIDATCALIVDICMNSSPKEAIEASGLSSDAKADLESTLSYGLTLSKAYSDNHAEIHSFLRGLCTEYIEQASGGDTVRSPEVLPTGRNLTQFDPTRVPTSTASARGKEIAGNTLAAYMKDNDSYPETVGVILWGFETTKTGGESVGQILSYLGLRIEQSPGTWAPKLTVVPIEELGRPRVDCLVNICGFFRDMFPNIVQLLDKAFNLVAELDEPVDMNFVRKHSIENRLRLSEKDFDPVTLRKMANGRIFGPKAGEYGTRMLPLVEDSIWRTENDLADVYIQSMNYLYAENIHAVKNDALYRNNLSNVQLVSQVRDTTDREIIDLDHYFEFFGGISNAVKLARGERPKMLITDTTEEVIRTEDAGKAVTRGARTRLLNPKWANAMLEHDFHGTQQIAERLENVLGLAATTNAVDNWIWSAIAGRYIFDEEMRKKLIDNNKFAAADIVERLLEAEKRGYWDAGEEEIEDLKEAYLEMEGIIEESVKEPIEQYTSLPLVRTPMR
ncbi:MAG: magnesium chelatase subunit H [Methanotrichaceae archaeon]